MLPPANGTNQSNYDSVVVGGGFFSYQGNHKPRPNNKNEIIKNDIFLGKKKKKELNKIETRRFSHIGKIHS